MGAEHSHSPVAPTFASAGHKHKRALATVLILVGAFVGVELAAGLWTGSLTLVADAGHMATDALGVAMALAAITAAARAAKHPGRTFGHYRWEVIAALANAVLLLGVSAYVAIEAVGRFQDPPEIRAWPMLAVAIVGLAINVVSFRLLHAGSKESLNVRGAYLEVMADMFGSVGVIISAVVILTTGWPYMDAIVALLLAAFIAPRAVRLGRESLRILTQSAPSSVDVKAVRTELEALPTVTEVHDLHVWTLTSGMEVASVHLVSSWGDTRTVLATAQNLLTQHGLAHATVQVESSESGGHCGVSW